MRERRLVEKKLIRRGEWERGGHKLGSAGCGKGVEQGSGWNGLTCEAMMQAGVDSWYVKYS